ncbi:hypothetical protein F5Y19DRAFT_475666 [Xylariaceae sp. FL1651]|nr:hypothetical protein F5Y19DRAFT_475666 [Xylariaceae sp. FL1651]
MVFCDRFFSSTTAQTKQDLMSEKVGPRRGERCRKDEKLPFFEVAGLTVLDEITHLDIVGSQAGLSNPPDPDGRFSSHGTVDVSTQVRAEDQAHYANLEPWEAARNLLQLWDAYDKDHIKYKSTTSTTENAESYAAAALEF